MKSIVLFGVLCLWLGGCDHIFAPDKCDSGPFCVTVDKSIYIAGELVRVTFHNHSSRPVFLPDCNNFFLATKAQTGWNERELLRCFVALPPVKVAPEATHKREHPTQNLLGMHKFGALVYSSCPEQPSFNPAQCRLEVKVYSPVFAVKK